jgi:hypothetical protein
LRVVGVGSLAIEFYLKLFSNLFCFSWFFFCARRERCKLSNTPTNTHWPTSKSQMKRKSKTISTPHVSLPIFHWHSSFRLAIVRYLSIHFLAFDHHWDYFNKLLQSCKGHFGDHSQLICVKKPCRRHMDMDTRWNSLRLRCRVQIRSLSERLIKIHFQLRFEC